nr:DUF1289 domain-containing protein [uncultured Duganella sp.]
MVLKSPCTGCRRECLRALDEARDWQKMTDHKRHQIVNDKTRRVKKTAKASGDG